MPPSAQCFQTKEADVEDVSRNHIIKKKSNQQIIINITLTKVSPIIFLFSSGLVVIFKVLLILLRGVLSSSEMGRVVVPL